MFISLLQFAEIQLEFEQPNYKGTIKDNTLQLTELILSQGYDDNDPVSVNINNGKSTIQFKYILTWFFFMFHNVKI